LECTGRNRQTGGDILNADRFAAMVPDESQGASHHAIFHRHHIGRLPSDQAAAWHKIVSLFDLFASHHSIQQPSRLKADAMVV